MNFHANVRANEGLATQIELSGTATIQSLRPRFYAMTGFTQESMKIKVNGVLVTDETLTLAELVKGESVNIDITGQSEFGDLNDVSEVKKFEITDEDYDKRHGTIREMKRKMGIAVKGEVPVKEEKAPEGIEVGQRCEVEMADHSHNRGTVRFVGKTAVAKGYWIGVELDEPVGKNDGSVKGHRYFQCDQNYGVFVREGKVKVGDYPPIDLEAELADEL